jgi:lipoprotein-releasing system permease protein
MFRPLPIAIGLRYTRAKRRNHFISFITFSSILGLALGVTALITVLSVMNGFEKDLRARILGISGHATIVGRTQVIDDWQSLLRRLEKRPHVIGAAPFVRSAAMVSHDGHVNGMIVNGIVPTLEGSVSVIGDSLRQGRLSDLKPGSSNLILGSALAEKLKVTVGDSINLMAPQPGPRPGEVVPEFKRFNVVGTFNVGMYDYDSTLALMSLADSQQLFRMGKAVSGIRLKFDDAEAAPALSRAIVADLGGAYAAIDWTQFYVNFFKALKSQKAMMFVIVTMIVAVAAFNIVSTLVMVVTDKHGDIAILRTLGLSPRAVMGVFIVQGLLIGLVGTVAGGVAGIYLARNIRAIADWLQTQLHVQFLPADVYFLSQLPYDIHVADIVKVCGVAFLLCLLATLYPAWRAARTQPADALRYE